MRALFITIILLFAVNIPLAQAVVLHSTTPQIEHSIEGEQTGTQSEGSVVLKIVSFPLVEYIQALAAFFTLLNEVRTERERGQKLATEEPKEKLNLTSTFGIIAAILTLIEKVISFTKHIL